MKMISALSLLSLLLVQAPTDFVFSDVPANEMKR